MLLDFQFYVCIVYVYSGVHVTRSLVLCEYCVCLQWGSCYSIFSFMCVLCMFIVGFMLLNLQFYVCIVYVYSGVHVTRSLVLCVYCVCLQWGSCYSIFSFMCVLCMFIVGFMLLDLQFYVCIVYVYSGFMLLDLQFYVCIVYVYSGVHVTRSLVLCVYCVCLQWGSCYSIFSFMFVLCMSIVGFMLLDLQFHVCIVYVYSGVHVTRSLVLCVYCVCLQWGSCYSIFSFMCVLCMFIVGFMLLDLQFYVCIVYVYSGFHVTRSLVLCVYWVCLQWGSCYSIFSFMCVLCMFIVGFMLLDLLFYVCIVYVYSGVHVTRSLILCVYCVCLQWGSCYSIFSFMCVLCMSIVGFMLLDLQFYVCIVYVYSGVHVTRSLILCVYCECLQPGFMLLDLQFDVRIVYVYSGVHVTRSLVLCVYCVCLQWGSCYSIFSFMCILCMFMVGFMLLDLQFYVCIVYVYSGVHVTRSLVFMCVLCMSIVGFMLFDLQFYVCIVYVYSGVHVTRSLILCAYCECLQWGSCYSIFNFMCVLFMSILGFILPDLQFYVCIVYVYSGVHVTRSLVLCAYCVCLQWGSCYSIFSFMCVLCMFIVGFMLLDLQFYVCIVYVYSGVHVTRSLVLCVYCVCLQWGSCYSIFNFMCVLCMFIVGFMLLDLQFYVCIVYVYSGVHVTRFLVLCVYCVCLQWGSCYSIFNFMCVLCMFIVGFMLLDLQFYVCIVYVYSGVHVTRSLILCVYCVCLQWGSCYSIFSFMCVLGMFIVGFMLLDLQFYVCIVYVYSGVHVTRSLVLCVYCVCLQWGSCYSIFSFMCVLCMFIVGFMLLDFQFYVCILYIYSGVHVTRSLILCVYWYVYSGVHVTRSLVLCVYCVCLQWGSCTRSLVLCAYCVCLQWGSCYSIFNFMCVLCMFIVGVHVTRSLVLCVYCVCLQWGSCYSIFSFMCVLCMFIVGFMLLDLQFYVSIVYVYSGVHVTRSLVLCVYCVCLQWGSCYSIFSFMCVLCMFIVGFMLLDLQFYVCIVYVYSGVHVTRSLVLCVYCVCLQWGFMLLDLQFYVCIVYVYSGVHVTRSLVLCVYCVCLQWGSCYSIFSFMCVLCMFIVGFMLLDLQFYVCIGYVYSGVHVTRSLVSCVYCVCLQWVHVTRSLVYVCIVYVYSGVHVTRSLVLCVYCVCLQWVHVLDLQFYVCIVYVYSGVHVTRSLVLCVYWVCLQWGSCYSIFSFMCVLCMFIVGFMLLDLQFYVCIVYVYSGFMLLDL